MKMTQGKVTFSVMGLGGRASAYLSALQAYAPHAYQLVAVADPDPAKQARARSEYGLGEGQIFVLCKRGEAHGLWQSPIHGETKKGHFQEQESENRQAKGVDSKEMASLVSAEFLLPGCASLVTLTLEVPS